VALGKFCRVDGFDLVNGVPAVHARMATAPQRRAKTAPGVINPDLSFRRACAAREPGIHAITL
jgi:hypothetical protein